MLLYGLLLIWNSANGIFCTTFKDVCTVPNGVLSTDDSVPQFVADAVDSDQNVKALELLSNYHMRKKHKDLKIQVQDLYFTVTESIGSGAEGIAYLGKDFNGNDVVIKALLKEDATISAFQMEVLALEKLGRLIAKDEKHFIIVQTFIQGDSFSEKLEEYSSQRAGKDNYPSSYPANHLKQEYFEILWKFRNTTQMAHNDFRPYNVVGNEAIDFGRSQILSNDPKERQKEIDWDDHNAEKEWEWFYVDEDFDAIEKNPLLPKSLEMAYYIWDRYMIRYHGYDYYPKYRVEWMKVLHYIVETQDTESREFPRESEFYDQ